MNIFVKLSIVAACAPLCYLGVLALQTRRGELKLRGIEGLPMSDRITHCEVRGFSLIKDGPHCAVLKALTTLLHLQPLEHHYVFMKMGSGKSLVAQLQWVGNIRVTVHDTDEDAQRVGGGRSGIQALQGALRCNYFSKENSLRVADVVDWLKTQPTKFCLTTHNCQTFCDDFMGWRKCDKIKLPARPRLCTVKKML